MQVLTIFVLAFAPGIFWLWLIYSRDKYRPEPRGLVIRTFIFGILSALPVVIAETILGGPTLEDMEAGIITAGQAAYGAFIVAGLVEEMAKYLVVRYTIYRSPYFDEPMDGIVYASAAALGFASIENVGYSLLFGWEVMLARGWFSTLAHVFFPALWAYALGRRKVRGGRGNSLVIAGLLVAIVLHGAFNYFLFTSDGYAVHTFILFLAAGLVFTGLVRLANKQSPYRQQVATPLIICPRCSQQNDYATNFCTSCGNMFSRGDSTNTLLCSMCHSTLQKDSDFCTACGSRINRKRI